MSATIIMWLGGVAMWRALIVSLIDNCVRCLAWYERAMGAVVFSVCNSFYAIVHVFSL